MINKATIFEQIETCTIGAVKGLENFPELSVEMHVNIGRQPPEVVYAIMEAYGRHGWAVEPCFKDNGSVTIVLS